MMDSLKGMLLGLGLIPAAFVVVAIASQRPQASEKLAGALPIEQKATAQQEDKAVFVTGKIKAAPLGDAPFVKPGPYLNLGRSPQVYAWKETSRTEETGTGENKKKKVIYECELGWTSDPSGDYGNNGGCSGKPRFSLRNTGRTQKAAASVVADGKTFAIGEGVERFGFDGLTLQDSDIAQAGLTLQQNKLYFDVGCAGSPNPNCQRLRFSGTTYDPEGEHTVVGMEQGGQFAPFKNFMIMGVGDYDTTMELVASRDTTWTWIWFLLSVALLGGGMSLLVGPLLKLIEYIPLIGGFGANVIRFIFFVFAFVVMGITFLLLEYWYIVLALAVISVVALFVIARQRRAAAATA